MAGQPQTPQGGEPGPGGHGPSQEGSVVVETSGRYKKLEEGAQERTADAWGLTEPDRHADGDTEPSCEDSAVCCPELFLSEQNHSQR